MDYGTQNYLKKIADGPMGLSKSKSKTHNEYEMLQNNEAEIYKNTQINKSEWRVSPFKPPSTPSNTPKHLKRAKILYYSLILKFF